MAGKNTVLVTWLAPIILGIILGILNSVLEDTYQITLLFLYFNSAWVFNPVVLIPILVFVIECILVYRYLFKSKYFILFFVVALLVGIVLSFVFSGVYSAPLAHSG